MMLRATIIGYIRKPDPESIYIEIDDKYWPGALQVDQFSHIIVLWWIHERNNAENRSNLRSYPPREGAALSGVFASRSPARPTPIGLTVVKIVLLDEENRRIYIDQIDAIDGSPVVDIKPYMPFSEKVDDARVPSWFRNNVPRYTAKPLSDT
ncbi:MAG: tRNA (N6-threonylcarbamoyladenosine(37)-N6)-methyltransferase TrmO [Candidatus Thorarchaeota archaeon]|nr:tRNA (N6-threonylcarbamoyladenosine(37)-N6)-methyltransferase TrmO [Candidatus Thorarchaeota archaeon]